MSFNSRKKQSAENPNKKFLDAINTIKYYLTSHGISRVGLTNYSAIRRFAKLEYGDYFLSEESESVCNQWLNSKIEGGDIFTLSKKYGKGMVTQVVKKIADSSNSKRETDNHVEYLKFLKTPYWNEVKTIVLDRDGHKCTKCNSTKFLHVHHTTYRHHFNEKDHIEDLITLCDMCHKKEHKNKLFPLKAKI
jgi:hypothetical protein